MLQALTEGLGGAVVRMEVTGQASDPHVETKALPVIEDSFKILGTPDSAASCPVIADGMTHPSQAQAPCIATRAL